MSYVIIGAIAILASALVVLIGACIAKRGCDCARRTRQQQRRRQQPPLNEGQPQAESPIDPCLKCEPCIIMQREASRRSSRVSPSDENSSLSSSSATTTKLFIENEICKEFEALESLMEDETKKFEPIRSAPIAIPDTRRNAPIEKPPSPPPRPMLAAVRLSGLGMYETPKPARRVYSNVSTPPPPPDSQTFQIRPKAVPRIPVFCQQATKNIYDMIDNNMYMVMSPAAVAASSTTQSSSSADRTRTYNPAVENN